MGNHLSCISPAALDKRLRASSSTSLATSTVKFLHSGTGAVSELDGHLTAAEAMLEFPAHFLCCLPSAPTSCRGAAQPRISAVPADEELQSSQLYLLLPMHRLNTRFSLQEMAFFATLAAAVRRSNGEQPFKSGSAISQSKVAPFPDPTGDYPAHIDGALAIRSFSFKGLEEMSLNEGVAAVHMKMGLAKHATVRRSKSWMPKLETVEEYAVAS